MAKKDLPEWKAEARELIDTATRGTLTMRSEPEQQRAALRILDSPEVETAFQAHMDAAKRAGVGFDLRELVNDIFTTAITTLPIHPPHPEELPKKEAGDVAAAIRILRRHAPNLLAGDKWAVDAAIQQYENAAIARRRPGPKGSMPKIAIDFLSENHERLYGTPVDKATTALLRAAYPRSRDSWDEDTVKAIRCRVRKVRTAPRSTQR